MELNKKIMNETQSLRKLIQSMKVGDEVIVPRKIHTEQVVRLAASRMNRSSDRRYQVSNIGRIDEVTIIRTN